MTNPSKGESKKQEQSEKENPDVNETLAEEQNQSVACEPKIVTLTDIELEQLKKEVAEYKDKYLRLLAEAENSRKRMYKERQEMTQFALQNVMVDFLNPIDHMENALSYTEQMTEEVKHWALGFQMILGQFKDVLASNGVQPFNSKGEAFDPHRHEAIEVVETAELAPGVVVEENVRGYKMGDKIIRPARVKVAKAPTEPPVDIES